MEKHKLHYILDDFLFSNFRVGDNRSSSVIAKPGDKMTEPPSYIRDYVGFKHKKSLSVEKLMHMKSKNLQSLMISI